MLSHDFQVALTIIMIAVAAALALLTDYLRMRARRQETASEPAEEHSMAMHVLVPELPAPTVAPGRASRLAAALKQPRRQLSPAAQAAIERGAQLATTPRKAPGRQADHSLQRVG